MNDDKSISVTQVSDAQPLRFSVEISTGGTSTQHVVTVSKPDLQRLTGGRYFPAQLIEASILFLLDREPKEAMLRNFDITLISRYFPEFEDELRGYLALAGATSSAP